MGNTNVSPPALTNNHLIMFSNILTSGECLSVYKLVLLIACPVPTCLTVTELNGLCPDFNVDGG